jgi:hypothetical protein
LLDGLWRERNRYDKLFSTQVQLLSPNDLSFTDSIGRTTFVNTLCGKKVLLGKDADDASNAHVEEGVRIKPVTVGE